MGTALLDLRNLNHLTQKELSEKTGISTRTIIKYEKNIQELRKANWTNLEKLAKALNVNVDDILLEDTSVFLKRILKKETD